MMPGHLGICVILVLVGFFGGQGRAHDNWDRSRRDDDDDNRHRMCPSVNLFTHRCYEMTTKNSTCLVATIKGCDPDYTAFCKLQIDYEREPCMIYMCSDQGCCDDYTEDGYGKCVSEETIESIHCLNGGTKTPHGKCMCTRHFKGERCEVPICSGVCFNGGRCDIDNGEPKCICPSSLYSGEFCEMVSCRDSCLNGGECIQDGVLSRCKCTHGYQGDRCQFPIKENCPVVQSKSRAACGPIWNECESDRNCQNNTVKTACCHDGCKGVCKAPEVNQCTYRGKMYKSGETFSPYFCQKCVCQMYGEVTCSKIECNTPSCPEGHTSENVADHCCRVCQGMESTDKEVPRFTNCPDVFVVLNVSKDGDDAHLPDLKLNAVDAYGTKLDVFYTQTDFSHTRLPEISNNIHIVTAYSECDIHGRRAECNFRVLLRGGPYTYVRLENPYPPVFKSCPANIQDEENSVISWDEPVVTDNVDLYNIKVDGDLIRDKSLSVGTYAVSYTAWDYDMNQAICTFLVRIYEQNYYDQRLWSDNDYDRAFPVGTVVGICTGLLIAMGLCVCFVGRMAHLRREQDTEHQREQNDESVFTVNGLHSEHNVDTYGEKLPYLPEYTPRVEPPSYEQIELGIAEKVGTPIYEELVDRSNENTVLAPNAEENNVVNGEVNNAYENDCCN